MPSVLDFAYVALLALGWPLYEHLVDWPRFRRRLREDPAHARSREYRETIAGQWLIVAAGAALFEWQGRAWPALGLRSPDGWRLWVAVAIVAGLAALYALQARSAVRSSVARAKVRKAITSLELLVPHTASELRWFLAVAVTAGVCEEFVFRGYFVWTLAPWVGWWSAVALGTPIFGLLHGYQGRTGVVKTAIVGLLMAAVVALTGTLVTAMALHAVIDLGAGIITWIALRENTDATDPAIDLRAAPGLQPR